MVTVQRRCSDQGFTLIELLLTMTLFGMLTALAVMPLRAYQAAQEQRSASRDVVAALRNAQVRAVSEGTTYKVQFSAHQVQVFRGNAGVYSLARSYSVANAVTLAVTSPGFTPATSVATPSPAPVQDAYFYGRGTASAGSITVTRSSSATKAYTVRIEGLTARVSVS